MFLVFSFLGGGLFEGGGLFDGGGNISNIFVRSLYFFGSGDGGGKSKSFIYPG